MPDIDTSSSTTPGRPLAVVTGASSGIGFELARCCAENGFDLLVAADEPEIDAAAQRLRACGGQVDAVQCDLGMDEGIAKLLAALHGRAVDALLANAGRGLGKAFLDQDFEQARRVIETNVTGTVALVQQVGRGMRERRRGRILITGSVAGFLPGSDQAVYNGSKAFLDSFAHALANELKDAGITVTCLMPGVTDTRFFERADLLDTRVGTMKKDDPAMVARMGYHAMMTGKPGVVTGWKNKLQVAGAADLAKPIGVLIGALAVGALLLAAWPRRGAIAKRSRRLAQRGLAQGQQGLKTLGVFPETPIEQAGRKAGELLQRADGLLH